MKLFNVNKLRIRTKLLASFLILLVFIISVGVFGMMQVGLLHNKVNYLVNTNTTQVDYIMGTQSSLRDELLMVHEYELGEPLSHAEVGQRSNETTSDYNNLTQASLGTGIYSNVTALNSELANLQKIINDPNTGFLHSVDVEVGLHNSLLSQQNKLDTVHSQLIKTFSKLSTEINQYANQNSQVPNQTLLNTIMNINMISWNMTGFSSSVIRNGENFTYNILSEFSILENNGINNINMVDILANQTLANGQINQTIYNNILGIGPLFDYSSNSSSFMTILKQPGTGIYTLTNSYRTATENTGKIMDSLDATSTDILLNLGNIKNWVWNDLNIQVQSTNNQYNTAITLITAVIIISAIVCGILAFALTRNISPHITKLVEFNDKLAEGDLAIDAIEIPDERTDEIGILTRATNNVLVNLKDIIFNLSRISNTVATSSEEIASSSEETNASSEEISSISQRLAQGSQKQANQMEQTNDQSKKLRVTFEEKINEINNTSTLIESISSQINMLALNASIEAARAGEYGRGFAVVAENIRKLADDTKSSVQKVQNTTEGLSTSISQSIEKIAESIEDLLALTDDNASSAEEASASTEEQAASIQELSASAQELSNIALDLNDIVKKFKI